MSGRPLTPPLGHRYKITCITFCRDGRFLATVSWDSTARIWDVAMGNPVTPPLSRQKGVMGVHFSPDGRQLITAGEEEIAKLWELSTTAHRK